MQMKVTEYLLDAIEGEGLTHVFMVPGGLIDPLLMTIGKREQTRPGLTAVIAAHEGGAAFMAYGYSRASGRFGACLAIGGPGITNMTTALASAATDFVPVLAISGGVQMQQEGRGSFQDGSAGGINDIAIMRPVSRLSQEITHADLVTHDLRSAMRAMLGIPRGVAHLCIPADVMDSSIDRPYVPLAEAVYHPRSLDAAAFDRFWEYARGAVKIAILAGRGVEASQAAQDLIAVAERYDIPVMTTMGGKGVYPETHRTSLGYFGFSGTRHAIETVFADEIDVLLVLGTSLNQYDSFHWTRHLKPKKAFIQVDLNPQSMGRSYRPDVEVFGDCKAALQRLLNASPEHQAILDVTRDARRKWLEGIRATPRCYNEADLDSEAVPIHPARIVRDLRRTMPDETILLNDGGAHAFFTMHYWQTRRPGQHMLAMGIGAMGWAIPAAIGVHLARPDARVVVVTGDGCMGMHGMELKTASRYKIPIIVVVFNNAAHGNVYLRVKRLAPEAAHLTELPQYDWAALAASLGVPGVMVERPDQLVGAFEQALAAKGPFLVDVRCDRDAATPSGPWSEAVSEWNLHH